MTNVSKIASDYNTLKSLAIQKKAQLQSSYNRLVDYKNTYEAKTKEHTNIRHDIAVQDLASNLLVEIIDKLSTSHIKELERMLTIAVKSIFYNQDYEVIIKVDTKRNNKSAEFYLKEGELLSPIYGNSGVGGGVKAVLGLVLQCYYILHFNLAPILLLDEALSQISEEYVPYTMQFMKELAEKKGFIFLLITHDVRFPQYANKVYEVSNGEYILVKEELITPEVE